MEKGGRERGMERQAREREGWRRCIERGMDGKLWRGGQKEVAREVWKERGTVENAGERDMEG